jgi:hypothetical protein
MIVMTSADAGTPAGSAEIVFRPAGRDVATMVAWLLAVPVVIAGYLVALGADRLRTIPFWVLVAVIGTVVLANLAVIVRALAGPHPALTRAGVVAARRPWGRPRPLPWDRVRLCWIDGRLGNRALVVLARGEHGSRLRYLPLWGAAPEPAAIDAAVRAFGDGRVLLLDRPPAAAALAALGGPEPGIRRAAGPPLRRVPLWTMGAALLAAVLLAPLALGLPEPWNQPWWPGTHQAMRAPDPCAVPGAAARATLLGPADAAITRNHSGVTECVIRTDAASLTVRYSVHQRLFGSGTGKARAYLTDMRLDARVPHAAPEPVGELGGDATVLANPPGTTADQDRSMVVLLARRANVVVEIRYRGGADPVPARAAVLEVARSAVTAIRAT